LLHPGAEHFTPLSILPKGKTTIFGFVCADDLKQTANSISVHWTKILAKKGRKKRLEGVVAQQD
jgi:hypothetical protein